MTVGMRVLLGVWSMSLPVSSAAQVPPPKGEAGPAKSPSTSAEIDRQALDVLRDVHNRGAELYNRGDPSGCFRLYEGALLVVRPFFVNRPAIQKVIDEGLAEVARTDGVKIRAFRLHEVIEDVRGRLKVELKLTGAERPTPMPVDQSNIAPRTSVRGIVSLDGKPAANVEVTFVTLDEPQPKIYSTITDETGIFSFSKSVRLGKYVVMVTSSRTMKVPERYQTTGTSGLTVDVTETPNELKIDLSSK